MAPAAHPPVEAVEKLLMRTSTKSMATIPGFIIAMALGQGFAGEVPLKPPPLPYEDHGACPFECCVYRAWSVLLETNILTKRQDKAKTAFRVRPGDEIIGVTGVVVTTRFGRAVVDEPTTIAGHYVLAGTTIPVLNYLGEGIWRIASEDNLVGENPNQEWARGLVSRSGQAIRAALRPCGCEACPRTRRSAALARPPRAPRPQGRRPR